MLQAGLLCSYCNNFHERQICPRHQQGDLFIMKALGGDVISANISDCRTLREFHFVDTYRAMGKADRATCT